MSTTSGRVLVYGGKGALGSAVVSHFKSKGWWVVSTDMKSNEQADANVLVNPETNWTDQSSEVASNVASALDGHKLDAVLCVAGGWAGGNANAKDFVQSCEVTWKQSVWTSVIASQLASSHLRSGGLLVLTGAKAAADGGTPGMIGYGLAKSAVHHLVKSLSCPKSGLCDNVAVLAILPVTLDTPMNRKWMPKADFGTWTPLEYVAGLLHGWTNESERPESGSLVKLITESGQTTLQTE